MRESAALFLFQTDLDVRLFWVAVVTVEGEAEEDLDGGAGDGAERALPVGGEVTVEKVEKFMFA